MKWIAFILAFGIFALSVKPVVELFHADDHCVEQSACCSSKAGADTPVKDDKGCHEDVCNPFLSCCAPVLMTPQQSKLQLTVAAVEYEQLTYYQSSRGLLSECDVWQPPELS